MARDCVVTLEKDSVPRVLFCGEDLMEAKLPAGTRVVYAKPPLPGIRDHKAAVRHAVEHPENMEPLRALLRPGPIGGEAARRDARRLRQAAPARNPRPQGRRPPRRRAPREHGAAAGAAAPGD